MGAHYTRERTIHSKMQFLQYENEGLGTEKGDLGGQGGAAAVRRVPSQLPDNSAKHGE